VSDRPHTMRVVSDKRDIAGYNRPRLCPERQDRPPLDDVQQLGKREDGRTPPACLANWNQDPCRTQGSKHRKRTLLGYG
jgi:hypothetical protein